MSWMPRFGRCIQEGYRDGFGADGDHLKTPEDIDRYAKAGFTMFTLDIGLHVINESAHMPMMEIRTRASALPWDVLKDTLDLQLPATSNNNLKLLKDLSSSHRKRTFFVRW